MKKDHVPNNMLDRFEERRKLWRKIKARLPSIHEKDDIYLQLQNKVIKYEEGKMSITELGSDVAILMQGHPDLIHEFDQLIPETLQDSCTLLSQHLAATYLKKPDLHDEGYVKVFIDSFSDTDTEFESEYDESESDSETDWNSESTKLFSIYFFIIYPIYIVRHTKLGECTIPDNLWKKIEDRFLKNYDLLQDRVDEYEDGRKFITELSSDVSDMSITPIVNTLLRGHPDLIDEFRKWIPITPNKDSDEVMEGLVLLILIVPVILILKLYNVFYG
ncbi:uncharacterized protein DS421_16g563420 [Arachis hypogaea]|nr:uncharacterized protein DS421_16g563420 [Arachis hypogaea]